MLTSENIGQRVTNDASSLSACSQRCACSIPINTLFWFNHTYWTTHPTTSLSPRLRGRGAIKRLTRDEKP